MSDIVKDMRESFETLIGTTLGVDWKVLDNKYKLDKNNYANQTKRFGVVVGSGDPGVSITKNYTVDRIFTVTLCQQYESIINEDSRPEEAINDLEYAMDEIIKSSLREKLGSPQKVLNLFNGSINDIDLETIENVAILVFDMIVTYRAPIAQ